MFMEKLLPASASCIAAAAIALGGCASSGVAYVKSGEVERSERTAFFKLPADWGQFDEEEFLGRRAEDISEEQLDALRNSQWVLVFDAAPEPSLDHLGPEADHPTGFAQVRALPPGESDYSAESLREEVFPIEQLTEEDGFTLIEDKDMAFPGDIQGSRVTFSFEVDDEVVTVDQIGAFDPNTKVVYLLVVSCNSRCYEGRRDEIDRIMKSWTVEGELR